MKRHTYILPALLLILVFVSHLPFLEADPDINISFSRGPFTDEGLNTIQIRNYVNHGYLDLSECDNLLKTPLFNLYLLPVFSLFGTSLLTGRLAILGLFIGILMLLSRNRYFGTVLVFLTLISFMQFEVFQFSHFCLAEMMAGMFIISGIYFFYRYAVSGQINKSRIRFIILSGIMFSLAYYVKVQFIYIWPLLIIALLIFSLLTKKCIPKKDLRISVMMLAGILILYLVAWYLPNKTAYDHMMKYQSGTLTLGHKTWEYVNFNLDYFIFSGKTAILAWAFVMALVTGIIFLFRSAGNGFTPLFTGSLTWVILELHKLTMVYFPTRYQVSLYLAMGLVIAVVMTEALRLSESFGKKSWKRYGLRSGVLIITLLLIIINAVAWFDSLKAREYNIRNTNQYLAEHIGEQETIIGSWTPALNWDCKARAFPVWDEFLNYKDPVNTYHPRIVVSEPDEEDSNQAYLHQGIDLLALSDSTRTVRLGQWDLVIYWIGGIEKD